MHCCLFVDWIEGVIINYDMCGIPGEHFAPDWTPGANCATVVCGSNHYGWLCQISSKFSNTYFQYISNTYFQYISNTYFQYIFPIKFPIHISNTFPIHIPGEHFAPDRTPGANCATVVCGSSHYDRFCQISSKFSNAYFYGSFFIISTYFSIN